MRITISTVALALCASLAAVNAQIPAAFDKFPKCANSCLITAGLGSGCSLSLTANPSAEDIKCLCASSSFTSSVTECAKGACNADEQKELSTQAASVCQQAGAAPPAGLNGTTNGTATQSPSPTGSPTGAPNGNAGAANIAGMGAVALGVVVAAFAL
ncbi:hypothetical protein BDV95DRAFT_612173 [Massariosphaeria phaeospora]|uniref:CFEM domain-containing protein n=1 Tax=Massariosphaeria phaeospora TaxID=100035 RepID=A0A7C8I1Y8_9PLEO|nr:hypothetical protein BDV95DRAFT_612173 [Massariosphaeria phaeospora]